MTTIFQYILVGVTVLIALGYLFRKQLFPKKKSTGCGDGDCSCH